MNKIFSNNYTIINLYKTSSYKSKIVTQMIYGESFKVINKYSKWMKIQIKEDKYIGYIKKKKIYSLFKANP